jgi:hypothetical protein
LLGACAFGADGDEIAQTDQDIVRGHRTHRFPQVVAVHVTGFNGFTQCTGTYVADRVVVTAAHCMRADAIPGQTFIYHGRDYLGDRESLPSIPAPGERSPWARVETSVTNPAYDASVNYPDAAILFLDRELPFKPMPLYRHHLSASRHHATIVGWGGRLALTPDISEVEGAGIKRVGKVHIMGSPTEADFHADDPNPGILVPEIRADLVKTIGDRRHANACAGDSGGPLIVEKHGKDYMAGIGMWTGLFCEDYSIFTRTDAVIDFIDDQIERAGRSDIVPRLECVEAVEDGSFRAHYGYTNDNGLTVEVDYGRRNSFPLDTEGARPSAFAPGDSAFAFGVDFTAGQELTWRLSPKSGPTTVVTANQSSPACDPNNVTLLCANQCDASLGAECSDGTASRLQCVNDCVGNAFFFEYFGCGVEWNAYLSCVGDLPSDAANWDCSIPGIPPFPASPNCEAELFTAFACAGY